MDEDRVKAIIKFWFEDIDDQTHIDKTVSPFKKWFLKDNNFDLEIKNHFESDILNARTGAYKRWEDSPSGRLALIILFDQFPRNIYRNTPDMFAFDPLALELSQRFVKEAVDAQMPLIYRVFIYMPFMHSEDLRVQKLCIDCFENLIHISKDRTPYNTGYFEYNLQYAKKHCEIIERFGRFPHRNAILNRASTAEEKVFLTQPGSSF